MKNAESHATVRVQWGGFSAEIDELIAPLVLELWKAKIATYNSCQDNPPGRVWIEFATADDAERFLDIVAEYDEDIDGLYNRIRHGWDHSDGTLDGAWNYTVSVDDLAVSETIVDDAIDESHSGKNAFFFSVSIRFPHSDLPIVLDRMIEHNKESNITQ